MSQVKPLDLSSSSSSKGKGHFKRLVQKNRQLRQEKMDLLEKLQAVKDQVEEGFEGCNAKWKSALAIMKSDREVEAERTRAAEEKAVLTMKLERVLVNNQMQSRYIKMLYEEVEKLKIVKCMQCFQCASLPNHTASVPGYEVFFMPPEPKDDTIRAWIRLDSSSQEEQPSEQSREQPSKSSEQPIKSSEQLIKSCEQPSKSSEQLIKSCEQPIKSSEQPIKQPLAVA